MAESVIGNVIADFVSGSFRILRFSTGIQIEHGAKTFTSIPITKTYGSMYEHDGELNLGDWPVSFLSGATPRISIENRGSNCVLFEYINGTSATSIGRISVCRPTSLTVSSFTVDIIGIGRWK